MACLLFITYLKFCQLDSKLPIYRRITAREVAWYSGEKCWARRLQCWGFKIIVIRITLAHGKKYKRGYNEVWFSLPFETPSHSPEGVVSRVFFWKYVKYTQIHANTDTSCCGNWNMLPTLLCTLTFDFPIYLGSFQIGMLKDQLTPFSSCRVFCCPDTH